MTALNEFLSEHHTTLTTLAIALPFGLALSYWLKREKTESAEDQLPLAPDGTYVLRASRSRHFFYIPLELIAASALLYVAILFFYGTFVDITDGTVDSEIIIIDVLLSIAAGCGTAYFFYRIYARYRRLSDQITVSAEGIAVSRWQPFRGVTASYAWADIKSVYIDEKETSALSFYPRHPMLHIVTAQQEEATSLYFSLLDRHFYDAINYYHAVATDGPDADESSQQQFVTYQKAWWNQTFR